MAAASALIPLASASSVRNADSISSRRCCPIDTFGSAIVPKSPPPARISTDRPAARSFGPLAPARLAPARPGSLGAPPGQPGVNHNRFTSVNQNRRAASRSRQRGLCPRSRLRCPFAEFAAPGGAPQATRDRLKMLRLRSSRRARVAGAAVLLGALIGAHALAQAEPPEVAEGLRAGIDADLP